MSILIIKEDLKIQAAKYLQCSPDRLKCEYKQLCCLSDNGSDYEERLNGILFVSSLVYMLSAQNEYIELCIDKNNDIDNEVDVIMISNNFGNVLKPVQTFENPNVFVKSIYIKTDVQPVIIGGYYFTII